MQEKYEIIKYQIKCPYEPEQEPYLIPVRNPVEAHLQNINDKSSRTLTGLVPK